MKFLLLIFTTIFLFGCILTGTQNSAIDLQSQKNDQSTPAQVSEPTNTQIPEPTFTPTIKPSPTENKYANLESVQIGWSYSDFSIIYDPSVWDAVEHDDEYSDLTYNRLELKEDPTCVFYETLGRGWGPVDLASEVSEKMGSFDCQIKELKYEGSDDYFLVLFNFDEEQIFISVEPGNNPAACIDAARTAIRNSAENGFAPESFCFQINFSKRSSLKNMSKTIYCCLNERELNLHVKKTRDCCFINISWCWDQRSSICS